MSRIGQHPRSRQHLGLLLGFVGMVIFAGTLPVTRLAVGSLDPFFMTALRAALAGVTACGVLAGSRRRLPPTASLRALVLVAICVVLGYPIFTACALVTVPAAHGGVVLGVMPLASAACATAIAGERPSPAFWLLGLAGAALVAAFALRNGGGALAGGDLFFLGSIACGALGYTMSGRLTQQMPGWEVISWALAIALPFAALACALLWPAAAADVPLRAWGAVAFLALFPQYIGFFFWNKGMALGGIARISQIQLLQTFVIVALAVPINHETIDFETWAFTGAVAAVVALGLRTRIAR